RDLLRRGQREEVEGVDVDQVSRFSDDGPRELWMVQTDVGDDLDRRVHRFHRGHKLAGYGHELGPRHAEVRLIPELPVSDAVSFRAADIRHPAGSKVWPGVEVDADLG